MNVSTTKSGMTSTSLEADGDAAASPSAVGQSYTEILRSTALIGGSSVINIAFGIFRTKVMAILLGPSGVGLMGLYGSIADLSFALAGMGIQSSGTRQIAEAVGSGEKERIARTATVLNRVSVYLGLIGAFLLIVFARPISALTFEDYQHASGVAVLSVAVFFRLVSAGQGALLQGLRRIADMAMVNVLGAILGTVAAIPLVYFFREDGVVPSLVAFAALTLLTSWWYCRKTQLSTPAIGFRDVWKEAGALLKLGGAFMASAFLTMGAAYAIRIIVLRIAGFEAAGLYQSAWALGGLYVGFILQAMGADFYPRLTGVAHDHPACNRMVNEQAQISLLLAGPGVIATLTLAPVVVALFYSREFAGATDLLRWICLGMTLRVVAFPMGYIVLAKGAQQIFFMTEVVATIVHVGLAWLFVERVGLNGAGAAFFGLYAWHAVFIYVIVRRLTGFHWSAANRRLLLTYLPLTGGVFSAFYLLPAWGAATLGGIATLLTSVHSLKAVVALVPRTSIPRPLVACLVALGFLRSDDLLPN
jgi:antigen flippase